MVGVLREISVTCFFSSYLVALGLELLRAAGRIPGRGLMVAVMTAVGIFTHIVFLTLGIADAGDGHGLLASWTDWALLVALMLAFVYIAVYLRRPETVVGLFFLPAVLAMIALAVLVRDRATFSRGDATEIWRTVHGGAMTVGTGIVMLGFLAGVMYLVQSWRLKNHRAGSRWKLPTLETLVRWNRMAMIAATVTVGIGVLAGVVMNLNRWGYVGWTDRGVLLSIGLFLWLLAAAAMDTWAHWIGRNRKAVYLMIASAIFLVVAVAGVLSTSHGGGGVG